MFVRGIAVFAENAADEDADLGLRGFAERPINRHAFADMGNQFARDVFQRRLAENFYGAVVGFQGVIKRNFVVREAEACAALLAFAHLLGEFDQFRDDLRGFDGSVLVFSRSSNSFFAFFADSTLF